MTDTQSKSDYDIITRSDYILNHQSGLVFTNAHSASKIMETDDNIIVGSKNTVNRHILLHRSGGKHSILGDLTWELIKVVRK